MATAVHEPSSKVESRAERLPDAPADDARDLDGIERPPLGTDIAAQRRRQAVRLLAAAGNRRDVVDRRRYGYQDRLHRASDDFRATKALRVAEAALAMAPRSEGLWAWQRRERQPRRRWWQRESR